jgi:hypothetical protein
MAELLEAWCFKGAKEVVIWFVLLFCKLLRKDLGEMVSMMEHNPGCSMETLYELCESQLCKGINEEISREKRDEKKRYICDAN